MKNSDQQLQVHVQEFIRRFGLLESRHTPCGIALKPAQAHALQLLAQLAEPTQQTLAARLHIDKSTASRLVTQLVEHGWVDRAENPHNRREARLKLTQSGETLVAEILAASAAWYGAIWARIPVDQRPLVLEVLATLTAALATEETPCNEQE